MIITKEAGLDCFRIREVRLELAGPSWAEGDCYSFLQPGMIVAANYSFNDLRYVCIERVSYAANVAGCTWGGRLYNSVKEIGEFQVYEGPTEEDIMAAIETASRVLEETA